GATRAIKQGNFGGIKKDSVQATNENGSILPVIVEDGIEDILRIAITYDPPIFDFPTNRTIILRYTASEVLSTTDSTSVLKWTAVGDGWAITINDLDVQAVLPVSSGTGVSSSP